MRDPRRKTQDAARGARDGACSGLGLGLEIMSGLGNWRRGLDFDRRLMLRFGSRVRFLVAFAVVAEVAKAECGFSGLRFKV